MMGRDWNFKLKGADVDIAIDLCNWLVGIAWGPRDMVIWPLPCISITVVFYDQE
jgi:hypothetical protein